MKTEAELLYAKSLIEVAYLHVCMYGEANARLALNSVICTLDWVLKIESERAGFIVEQIKLCEAWTPEERDAIRTLADGLIKRHQDNLLQEQQKTGDETKSDGT